MKKLLCLITASILFCGAAMCQDLQVRSINITNTTSGVKLNGKNATNSLSASTFTRTFADTMTVDFQLQKFQEITLTDSVVFISKNLSPGHMVDFKITGASAIVCTLGFPATWKFTGTKPTSIAATKTAILTIRSYGTTDASVVATYSVEP